MRRMNPDIQICIILKYECQTKMFGRFIRITHYSGIRIIHYSLFILLK